MALIGKLNAINEDNSYCSDMDDVYFKVVGVFIDTEKENVRVQVRGWMSEYARHNQGIGIYKKVHYIPLEQFKDVSCTKNDLVTKAYEYLKSEGLIEDAKDSMKQYSGPVDIKPETEKEHMVRTGMGHMINEL